MQSTNLVLLAASLLSLLRSTEAIHSAACSGSEVLSPASPPFSGCNNCSTRGSCQGRRTRQQRPGIPGENVTFHPAAPPAYLPRVLHVVLPSRLRPGAGGGRSLLGAAQDDGVLVEVPDPPHGDAHGARALADIVAGSAASRDK